MKVQKFDRRSLCLRWGIGFSHSSAKGGPVLKGETSWRTINGFWINTNRFNIWVELWRHDEFRGSLSRPLRRVQRPDRRGR